MPPVTTLLESADRPPPIPARVLEGRREWRPAPDRHPPTPNTLQFRAGVRRREREQAARQDGRLPVDWGQWSEEAREAWLEDNGIPRFSRPAELATITSSLRESPESLDLSDRPQSQDGPQRSALPTPPHDESVDPDSLFLPPYPDNAVRRAHTTRSLHPLSRSWRPDSPVNGLGDRNRSPTPADGWEVMRATIAPDEHLPSADSSFTSAVVSQSFSANNSFESAASSNNSTTITEPDQVESTPEAEGRNEDDYDDSVSSIDPDDLVCSEEEREATATFAEHMFYDEHNTSQGHDRIRHHTDALAREGRRYALHDEIDVHEIGFRLIDEALDSPEGRVRVFRLTQDLPTEVRNHFEEWIFDSRGERRDQSERSGRRRTRRAQITDDEPPSPHPERYSSSARAAVREASEQVHDYFRRVTAEEALTTDSAPLTSARAVEAAPSPPPRYEPLASHPDVNTFTSRDGPEPHPVSPPSARSERDIGDALLSGDEQDLQAMRRVVERLAQRDDVPEEWWMSMGLNLSRTRARSRTRSRSPRRQGRDGPMVPAVGGTRVRAGRIERERNASSRL